MKRLIASAFALSIGASVWAQDAATETGPAAEDAVTRQECEPALSGADDCDGPVSNESIDEDGPSEDEIGDLLNLLDDESGADETDEIPDLENLLRLDQGDDDPVAPDTTDTQSGEDAEAANDTEVAPEAEPDNAADSDAGETIEAVSSDPEEDPADDDGTPEVNTSEAPRNEETTTGEAIEASEADLADSAEGDESTASTDDADPDTDTADETPNPDGSESDTSQEAEADGDAAQPETGGSAAADESDDPTTDEASPTDGAAEVDDADAAEDPAPRLELALTTSTPFLTSDAYAALRAESRGEQLQLVWTIRRETSAGDAVGDTETRTLFMAPDFIRDESAEGISIFDFLTDRHLEIDPQAGTYTNTAFAAEVRRRLDTYLGLSQGGRLQDIPIGPERSFDRFWLEAAMGIRREPVTLTRELDGGDLSVERAGGLVLLTARFDIAEAETPDSESDGTGADAAPEESEADALRRAATPIDLTSDESVVFDPSQAALPINLNLGDARIDYPEATPEAQAQAELFRRWMRHALPVHPDVLSALEGAPHIPASFSYYIVSPESPAGRREIWTLQSMETTQSGLRLEPGLEPAFNGPDWLGNTIVPTAIAARETGATFDVDAMLAEIEQRRNADDAVGAYLVSLQEQHHFGPCPTATDNDLRAVCSATSSVVASGLGDPGFEALFGAMSGPSPSGDQVLIDTLQPYLGEEGYAGAAARILTAKALLRWAARDPESVPDNASPFDLLSEAIAIDPVAGAAWWEAGNALLVLRDPLGAWTVFDTGRAILPEGMIQVIALEDRLRVLAPEFFLPR